MVTRPPPIRFSVNSSNIIECRCGCSSTGRNWNRARPKRTSTVLDNEERQNEKSELLILEFQLFNRQAWRNNSSVAAARDRVERVSSCSHCEENGLLLGLLVWRQQDTYTTEIAGRYNSMFRFQIFIGFCVPLVPSLSVLFLAEMKPQYADYL